MQKNEQNFITKAFFHVRNTTATHLYSPNDVAMSENIFLRAYEYILDADKSFQTEEVFSKKL